MRKARKALSIIRFFKVQSAKFNKKTPSGV